MGHQPLVHPEDLSAANQSFSRGIGSGEPWASDFRMRRGSDGSYRWIESRVRPIKDARGLIVGWCSTMSDVDDRRRAEETANQARAELAHVTRVTTLNVLTASIAHEVNQPLAAIMMNTNTGLRMLGAEPANLEGARIVLGRVIRDSTRAANIIERLRAMYAKETSLSANVDLNDAARNVIAIAMNDLRRNNVVLHTSFAPDLPTLRADRVQLQQVILNLLLNASEAMSRVAGRERSAVVQTRRSSPSEVCLSVRDAGHGFAGRDPEHVFEAFYTTKETGMGIGLSISRSIVESHNGRLWATSNEGPGATFAFALPLAIEAPSRAGVPGSMPKLGV